MVVVKNGDGDETMAAIDGFFLFVVVSGFALVGREGSLYIGVPS